MSARAYCHAAGNVVLLLLAGSAAGAEPATPPSPVLQHYRLYRAALEQGNLAVAETEAASALASSSELNGDGPPTAALAVNLAGLRLIRKEHAAAIEPARRALAIAQAQGDASGVDVHVPQLLLGRAELPGGDAAAMERLMQAVREAQSVPGLDDEAYPAAVELAVAAHDTGRYPLSIEAWIASAQFAKGSRVNADYARARAKLGEASARIVPIATVPAGAGRGPVREFEAIDALLAEAMDLIHDQAVQSEIGGDLTLAQSVYGEAAALKGGLGAKLKSDQRGRWQQTPPKKQNDEIRVAGDVRPRCARHWVAKPLPTYPPARSVAGGIGSVVLKVQVDDAGAVSRVQVAGAAGGQDFADSVVAAARRWRVEMEDGAVPGCHMAGEVFIAVSFVYP